MLNADSPPSDGVELWVRVKCVGAASRTLHHPRTISIRSPSGYLSQIAIENDCRRLFLRSRTSQAERTASDLGEWTRETRRAKLMGLGTVLL